MTIALRDELAYILLKNIQEGKGSQGESEIRRATEKFVSESVSETDLLGHLDYLN